MRHLVLAVGAMAIILVWALPSAAEPTILGPTGLIVNPTADITPVEHAWIALNFFDNNDNSIWTANFTGTVSEGFEVGVGAVHPDNGDDGITFFGKWQFMPEAENMPGAAGGVTVTDIAGDSSTMWYVVVSKLFFLGENASENASMHGGLSYVTGGGDEELDLFGGVDLEFMENVFAIFEYTGDDSSVFEGFTLGVRYYINLDFSGQAALIDGDLHVGVSYIL